MYKTSLLLVLCLIFLNYGQAGSKSDNLVTKPKANSVLVTKPKEKTGLVTKPKKKWVSVPDEEAVERIPPKENQKEIEEKIEEIIEKIKEINEKLTKKIRKKKVVKNKIKSKQDLESIKNKKIENFKKSTHASLLKLKEKIRAMRITKKGIKMIQKILQSSKDNLQERIKSFLKTDNDKLVFHTSVDYDREDFLQIMSKLRLNGDFIRSLRIITSPEMKKVNLNDKMLLIHGTLLLRVENEDNQLAWETEKYMEQHKDVQPNLRNIPPKREAKKRERHDGISK